MVSSKVKITAVSYLNTKPLLYGLVKSEVADRMELQLDIPSGCARRLAEGSAQLGLVPVAVLPELESPRIISDYCIGAEGEVRTVCVYAEKPLEELDAIYLDYHSRTSVELVKILLREYWNLSPKLIPATEGYEESIKDAHGGLVIGDRCIDLETAFPFRYDLGEAWEDYCGLPFVFAAWVSTVPLEEDFVRKFNDALRSGVEGIPEFIYLLPELKKGFDAQAYFTRHISYELDAPKREALAMFLRLMNGELQPSLADSLSAP